MIQDLNPDAVAAADMVAITSSGFDIPLRHVIRAAIRAYLAADALPEGQGVPVGEIAALAVRDEAQAFLHGE